MTDQLAAYDSAECLDTSEKVVAYLDAVFEDNDATLAAHAIGVVARARGLAAIAHETGRSRESLYRTLSDRGNPGLRTLMGVLKAMGLRLSVQSLAEVDR